jgi:predicted Zn-dependent peptidase
MSDIQNFTRPAATEFFKKYYGPSNLVASIVGDVKAEEVFQMAERYWGRIPYRPKPDRIITVEPPQLGERRMVIEDPSQPQFIAAWHMPEITHPDRVVIDVLSGYLGGGRTSPLYRSMVKEKMLAAEVSIYGGAAGEKYPTIIMAEAIPANGRTNAECEAELMDQIEKVKTEPIAASELEKIKTRARAAFISGLANNQGLARQLATYHTQYGDWRQLFRELDRINAVTAEGVLGVANKYLTRNNCNVVTLETKQN